MKANPFFVYETCARKAGVYREMSFKMCGNEPKLRCPFRVAFLGLSVSLDVCLYLSCVRVKVCD